MRSLTVKKVWNWLSVVACVVALWLAYSQYRANNQTRKMEVQVYNQWMQLMLISNSYLASEGRGEKPRNGAFQESPNTALFMANKYMNMASELANGASWMSQGASQTIGRLGMVAHQVSQEITDMYDQGTYVKGNYQVTTPLRKLVADRNFMHSQVTETILKGMPTTVTSVGQIDDQFVHLSGLDVGVFSKDFENFMVSTGQMRVTSN